MTDKTPKNAFSAFYKERFNSSPDWMLDHYASEIADTAAEVGVDWKSISSSITLSDKTGKAARYRGKIGVTHKQHRGKVMVWAEIVRTDDGLEFPQLTFNHNNPSVGSSTWSGWSALAELYKAQGGRVSDEKQNKWKEAQAAKSAERERLKLEAEQRERDNHAREQNERAAYEQVWKRGGSQQFECMVGDRLTTDTVELVGLEDGSSPYFQAKQISDIAQYTELKRMRDRIGVFTAIPLYDIHGEFQGLQRLYDKKKYQGTGVRMDGLHFIIGDLNAKRVYGAEGFATGASIFLAEKTLKKDVAVIITFNVGNLLKVLKLFKKHRETVAIINAADDDQWTRAGNAGRLQALQIHRELGRWAVLPSFEDLSAEQLEKFRIEGKGPTDWNDFYCHFGAKATAKALRSREVYKAEKDYFDYCLQRVAVSGQKAEAEALAAISAGMLCVPIKFSTKQVIDQVLEALPGGYQFNLFKIKRRAVWLAKIKLSEAMELRGFSASALAKPHVKHLKIKGVRAEHGGIVLPDHIADLVESLDGCIIVRAPMGSGKTEKLIKPVMGNSRRAAYVAHRISLLDDAAARLEISLYSDVTKHEMYDTTHLACCVNSLTNPKFYNTEDRSWFTTIDTLCIDEASQVIRHTATGPVDSPVRVMDALIDAMATAKRVLLCDADANDSVIRLCEEARPGQPITILEIDGTMENIKVKFSDEESVWQKALDLILAGQRVLVANDSAESAKKMAAVVLDRNPETKLLLVHKDSKSDPQVDAFLRDPSAEALNYDVLLYSPAISSGVSMTQPHFQHHIGIFSGNTVGPSDAVQMLRRDRTAREYLIGIGHTSVRKETDRESIWRGRLAADVFSCQFEETSDEILLRRQKTAFDDLYLTCTAIENRAKNNFANNLLMMLHGDRYQVERIATDDMLAKASRANRKEGGYLVFNRRMELLASVTTPDEETFERLDRLEVRSEAEAAQIDRYQIENQLGVSQITADDVSFYDNRGISKLFMFELLQSTEAQALAYDKAQRKARVTLTKSRFKTPARAFLVDMFQTLGVDPVSGAGEFTAEACRAVLAKICESQSSAEMFNALSLGTTVKFGGKPGCATKVVTSILAKLGVGIKNRKSNGKVVMSLHDEHWSFMSGYISNRAAIGVHSLTTHDHTATHQPRLVSDAPAPAEPHDRDVSQGVCIAPDEKPPLDVRERIYAAARRSFKPLGSLVELIEGMAPEVVRGFASEAADGVSIGFTLAYAQRLHRSA